MEKAKYIGLFGKECERPAFWCRLHQVWLTDTDVIKKKCLNKPTFDMIGEQRCGCIELKNEEFLKDKDVVYKWNNRDKYLSISRIIH